MLWLSDLDFLRKRVEILESDRAFRSMAKASLNNVQGSKDAIKAWLARTSRGNDSIRTVEQPAESTEPTPTNVPSQKTSRKRKSEGRSSSPRKLPRPMQSGSQPKRLESTKDTASERDNECCVITKMGEPIQICHIYPYALGVMAESEWEKFWSHLEIFWPPETIARWKKDIMGPDGTEVPQNLLCLSTIVHDLWGSARLAFEPVEMSEAKTSLTMRFWWLPRRAYSMEVALCVAPDLPSDLKASPCNAKLWNCDTDQPIYSDQLVTMTTQDPEAMPLPSFDLLQMQWFLERVAAMSGAADVTDEERKGYFEGFYESDDMVRETSDRSSDDDDDDDDAFAYLVD
ncbi:hypothetical protein BDV40DRAFT_274645 [Aspergillus tamarii]|uniref:HNH nuclease domain-containing protein n=1 Tax=Aspergillus tamarii TaxID=41984 RepID=A0A5N6UJW3_ASPTM|nr:hypothetical protein BDV40DRAFT_274645 [Aspergillus tamarii]